MREYLPSQEFIDIERRENGVHYNAKVTLTTCMRYNDTPCTKSN